MNKKEIMSLVKNILDNNKIKAIYENGYCVISKHTPIGWKPVIFIDDNKETIVVEGKEYKY